jgi:hypothetical protein
MSVLHPVLNGYLNHFKAEHPKATGTIVHSGDQFLKDEHFSLKGGYFVCGSTLHYTLKSSIHCSGPGGALMGAKRIHLEGPEILLQGEQKHYVQLLAVENLKIKAQNLNIQNVVFCLFYDAKLILEASETLKINNVWVYSLTTNLRATLVHHWKDEQDYLSKIQNA